MRLAILLLIIFLFVFGCSKPVDQQNEPQDTPESEVGEPESDVEELGQLIEQDDIEEDLSDTDDLNVDPDDFLI